MIVSELVDGRGYMWCQTWYYQVGNNVIRPAIHSINFLIYILYIKIINIRHNNCGYVVFQYWKLREGSWKSMSVECDSYQDNFYRQSKSTWKLDQTSPNTIHRAQKMDFFFKKMYILSRITTGHRVPITPLVGLTIEQPIHLP